VLLPEARGLRQKSIRVVLEGITFAPHQILSSPRESPAVIDRRARPDFARRRFPPLLG